MKLLIKLFTFTFVFISAPLYANNLSTINIEYIIEKNIEFQNFLNNLNEEQKLMNDIFKKKNLQLENEKKEMALNKYQQIIRNIINANVLSKSKIKRRDRAIASQRETIDDQLETIQLKDETILDREKTIEVREEQIAKLDLTVAQKQRTIVEKDIIIY